VLVPVEFPGRTVRPSSGRSRSATSSLILLDTWLPQNTERDREITHRLYGGDKTRASNRKSCSASAASAPSRLGLKPTVWHVNEGHAAFLILERIRSLVSGGLPYAAALEAVASNVDVHHAYPVPAGHDHFSEEMIRHYFSGWCQELGMSCDQLMALGAEPGKTDFNMTSLACAARATTTAFRAFTAMSRPISAAIFGRRSSPENPMDYVTNGVHLQTFLAPEWFETFERYLGIGWQERQTEPSNWDGIECIPDASFWSIRQQLKSQAALSGARIAFASSTCAIRAHRPISTAC
jgi:starch phosphorylase